MPPSYLLGVDVGRTRCAAAVRRRAGSGYGAADVVALEGSARWLSSAIFLGAQGDLLAGAAAEQAGARQPECFARALLDRVGDDVPVLLAGQLYPAENLVAALVGWVVDVVAEAEGGSPERIAVTHPPEWGTYRRGLLRDALADAGLPGVVLLPTVVAAAEAHHADVPVGTGSPLVVTLLGGHRADHALLMRNPVAFDVVAHHVTPRAGAAVDDALYRHVVAAVAPPASIAGSADLETTAVLPAQTDHVPHTALRTACGTAKERLSSAAEVRVPVPHLRTDVTVSRAEFTELAAPVLLPALAATRALLGTATTAVIAGGTAKIPLVAHLAPGPVLDDPATAAARGAVLALAPLPRPALPATTVPDPESAPSLMPVLASDMDGSGDVVAVVEQPPPRPPVEVVALEPPPRRFALARRGTR
ncbi:molecular chaperone DnaK (HSP70) [Actinokineospora baliensis]|uniref:Hsp70 family protein n=1 Tax=Actinokineospora baliensis TaxID=547056 RepID=UPI0019562A4D|nr:Hsp70 family protein [Actinokineospora baliensis]MBM7769890.1 molecular chaperone DnaK (HSP70) [Actinokineospora baliensis]